MALSLGSAEAEGCWHLLGPLADVVQAEGGHMVLSAHKQPSALLIHQQSFIAAGPHQPEGPETVLGLELCRVGAHGESAAGASPDPVCCLSHRPWLSMGPGPHTCGLTRMSVYIHRGPPTREASRVGSTATSPTPRGGLGELLGCVGTSSISRLVHGEAGAPGKAGHVGKTSTPGPKSG